MAMHAKSGKYSLGWTPRSWAKINTPAHGQGPPGTSIVGNMGRWTE